MTPPPNATAIATSAIRNAVFVQGLKSRAMVLGSSNERATYRLPGSNASFHLRRMAPGCPATHEGNAKIPLTRRYGSDGTDGRRLPGTAPPAGGNEEGLRLSG